MNKNILKKQWFVVEEIPQNCYYMMSVVRCFVQDWPRWGLGNFVKHYISDFKNHDSRMIYIREEFDREADYLNNKMINNPDWALKRQKEIIEYANNSMGLCKKTLKLKLQNYTNKELIKIHDKINYYRTKTHGIGASITWHADADKERFSKYLINYLDKHLKNNKLNLNLAEAFSILTTPTRLSLEGKEEIALLKIVKEIKQKQKTRNLFTEEIYKKIEHLHFNYCWLTYQYLGPSKPMAEYIEQIKNLLNEKVDIDSLLEKIRQRTKNVKIQQNQLLKKLKLDSRHKKLFEIARRCVYIKGFRKSALFLTMYTVEKFFKEMGARTGLSLNQMRQLFSWEVKDALLKNEFSVDQLNERYKLGVMYVDRKDVKVYTGTKARNILDNLNLEKIEKKDYKKLVGTCACPGRAVGTVKIINLPEDMAKMNEGDILVSLATNPNLVPAMKKAVAIITNSGGLTCHAAIVARELKIPCVVGTKIATKVLRDGDLVEVDAEKGIIKKLKNV